MIDPHSQRPRALVASASVSGPDLGLADALATALTVAGEEGLAWFETLEGYEAFVRALDGTSKWTEHFPFASGYLPSPIGPKVPTRTGHRWKPGAIRLP